jgi:hypothetical protein
LYKSIQLTNKSPIVEDDYDGLRPIKIDYLLRMQCHSDLCETLVKVKRGSFLFVIGYFLDTFDRRK